MGQAADDKRLARLRYHCRRGMKELDLMLEGFVLQHAGEISAGGWPQLESLLACEDDQLWAWLQGRSEHPDSQLQSLIKLIRSGTPGAH